MVLHLKYSPVVQHPLQHKHNTSDIMDYLLWLMHYVMMSELCSAALLLSLVISKYYIICAGELASTNCGLSLRASSILPSSGRDLPVHPLPLFGRSYVTSASRDGHPNKVDVGSAYITNPLVIRVHGLYI